LRATGPADAAFAASRPRRNAATVRRRAGTMATVKRAISAYRKEMTMDRSERWDRNTDALGLDSEAHMLIAVAITTLALMAALIASIA
jgi:hypothetical protein